MEAAAKAMLSRADDMDVYDLPSDVDDEDIDSDDEQVVGRAEAKRIRKAKREAARSKQKQVDTDR